ncbi:MAG: alpha/beta hydrolase domain-containing protein [Myxococcales bacterium]
MNTLTRPRIALAVATLLIAGAAHARITGIQITSTESPTFGGFSWPGVGQYEKIVGKAFGAVDPADPKNSVIVDIALAKDRDGLVRYSFDFYILKPIDLRKGSHRVMYEPPNRGGKTWASLGRFPAGGDDPGSVVDPKILANAFLMPRGYTMVWSGWDKAAGTDNSKFNTTITLPIAKNPDGSSIKGPSYEYIVSSANSFALSYPAADPSDKVTAILTHRVHLDDVPQPVAASGWKYNAAGTAISLVSPTGATVNFTANDIYEFSYTAKDPSVNGLGFAAVRDWVAWLRSDTSSANPLAGDIRRVFTEISSQPGRMLNDFRHLGFNQAENGKKVFDGMMQWIAAGDGINMNYRFSQPGRTERNRQDHLYAEGVFPFANVMTHDPITGKTDSRLARCEKTNTCPVSAEIYSANEYWVKPASLLHTTPDGKRDLPDSPFSRIYFISSHQHGTGNGNSRGNCQQLLNPLNSAPVQRALFIALDEWLDGKEPPHSRVPTLRDGMLARPLPQSGMGFPHIPGVTYSGLKTTRYLFDYGPGYYETGIATFNPPLRSPPYQDNPANGPIYPSFIPRTDRDGNDIAGVRLADVTVPLATYTGWALRAGPQANDGCEGSGQMIPFPQTKAARLTAGDPRRSSEERYGTLDRYVHEVARALREMVDERLLLCEDYDAELSRLTALGATMGGLQMDASGAPKVPKPPDSCTKDKDDDD